MKREMFACSALHLTPGHFKTHVATRRGIFQISWNFFRKKEPPPVSTTTTRSSDWKRDRSDSPQRQMTHQEWLWLLEQRQVFHLLLRDTIFLAWILIKKWVIRPWTYNKAYWAIYFRLYNHLLAEFLSAFRSHRHYFEPTSWKTRNESHTYTAT